MIWLRAHLRWLLLVGLAFWTGWSVGWVDATAQFRATDWEGPGWVWVASRHGGMLVVRGDPQSVARVQSAIRAREFPP